MDRRQRDDLSSHRIGAEPDSVLDWRHHSLEERLQAALLLRVIF